MTPSMRVAGVTSKHGFHTYQEQTKDKPKDKTNVKLCSSVCAMAAAGYVWYRMLEKRSLSLH